jgi:DNA replication protein DnaC
MLANPTLERLHQLGLLGMAKAFADLQDTTQAADLSFEDRLGLMLDREADLRETRRYQTRLRQAKLRLQAAIEDIDFRTPRGLDKALVLRLADCQWITATQNLLIIGPTGAGKTWLACALGHQACRNNLSVLYLRLPRLIEDLALARADGRYPKLLRSLARVKLLILDDWGMAPLTAEARRDLLEIADDRHGIAATLITSQFPLDTWHELIGDPTLADAILDRIIHNAHRIQLKGESMRKKKRRAHTEDA